MLLVLAAMAASFAWWSTRESLPQRTHAPVPSQRSLPVAEAAPPASTAPETPPPRTTSSASPASRVAPRELDPCGSGEDDPPVTRPSLDELLQLRIAELNDRMRARLASPTASAALREGWAAAVDPARGDEALRLLLRAPDRIDEGFDTYVAVAMVLAARALGAHDTTHAVRLSENAARAAPTDLLPLVIGAIAHEHRAEHVAARDLLARAFVIDPEEPALAFSLAWRLEDGADIRAAMSAFDAYLHAFPDDRDMARRRARLAVRASSMSHGVSYTRGGLTLVADPSFSRERAMHVLDIVDAGLTRGASLLSVPRREELAIFVHADRDAMHRATCVQGWAGAVFDGALETDAVTLGQGGGDMALTHESFHASIHPAVPNVPTWLDEGLAQYVSGEEALAHVRSYELMTREHTWIPFASMNDAFLVIDDSTDAGLAYHQALAMVEWLVDRRGERGIRDAARWLIDGGDPSRVLAQAAHGELDGDALLAFVARHVAALHAQGHAPPP